MKKPVEKSPRQAEAIGAILERTVLVALEREIKAKRVRKPRPKRVKLAKPNRLRKRTRRRAKVSLPIMP